MQAVYIFFIIVVLAVICLFSVLSQLYFYKKGKKVKHEMNRQNRRLSQILQTTNVTLWTYDVMKCQFTIYNNKYVKSFRQTLEERRSSMSARDYKTLKDAISLLVSRETDSHTFFLHPDGTDNVASGKEIDVQVSVLKRDVQLQPAVLLFMLHDTTEERKRDRQTDIVIERYRSIFNTVALGVAIIGPDGHIRQMNSEVCDIIMTIVDVRNCIDRHPLIKDIFPFLNLGDISESLSFSAYEKDKFYFDVRLIPIVGDTGDLVCYCMQCQDNTESVMNYKKMIREKDVLDLTIRRNKTIVDQLNFVLANSKMRISIYDPGQRALRIYSELGKEPETIAELDLLKLVHFSSLVNVIDKISSMNALNDHIPAHTIRLIKDNDDGSPYYISVNMLPVKDDEGMIIRYFGTLYNDSKMIDSSLRLEEEKKKAQESDVVKSLFMKNMSYEIRTPLNAVVGFSGLLTEGGNDEEEKRAFVNEIKKNTGVLLSLINDVLLLSRLDAGMIVSKKRPVDYAVLFEDFIKKTWNKSAHSPETRLIVNSPFEQLIIMLDFPHLSNIIERLLLNAARFTPKGAVKVIYDYVGGSLVTTVEDSGIGIPREKIGEVMERFAKLDNEEGTGLGLPICQELARLLGGWIGIDSDKGKGTRAWMTLPCDVLAMRKKQIMYIKNER